MSKKQIDAGFIERAAASVRYVFTGEAPEWFGPGEPLKPQVTEKQAENSGVLGRQFDFNTAVNTNTSPRTGEAVTFNQMRALSENYDVLRLVIETRKDQMEKYGWSIKKIDGSKADSKCEEVTEFFKMPDGEHTWNAWLRMLLEDLFVIDAPALYVRPNKAGKMHSLEPIDGATIKRVIDNRGRTPLAPLPAYQQILKGMPAVEYTRDELLYLPRNVRTHKIYGYSPVEQIIMTVNIAIRRQVNQLEYYTEGNVPNMLFKVPKEWSMESIKQFQAWWDAMTMGASKSRGRFLPDGADPIETKQPPLKDVYDEWLARIVCFAFSIEPTPFISQVNRATAETSREQSLEEGIVPLKNWVKTLVDTVIIKYFGYRDIEFVWDNDETLTSKERAEIHDKYLTHKVLTPDEVRAEINYDPLTPEQRKKAFPEVEQPQFVKSEQAEGMQKAKKRLSPIDKDRAVYVENSDALEKYMTDFFAIESVRIAKELSGLLGMKKSDSEVEAEAAIDDLNLESWSSIIDDVTPFIAAVAVDAGSEAIAMIDMSSDEIQAATTEKVTKWARGRAAELVGMRILEDGAIIENPNAQWRITEGTRQMLRTATAKAIDEGWSTKEFSDAISSDYAFSNERANMIARTEIARADAEGAKIGWKELGVKQKEWLTAPDCCDICQEMDGKTALIDDLFEKAHDVPLHPNCRCSIIPVI